jgi:hypothetical protein
VKKCAGDARRLLRLSDRVLSGDFGFALMGIQHAHRLLIHEEFDCGLVEVGREVGRAAWMGGPSRLTKPPHGEAEQGITW